MEAFLLRVLAERLSKSAFDLVLCQMIPFGSYTNTGIAATSYSTIVSVHTLLVSLF